VSDDILSYKVAIVTIFYRDPPDGPHGVPVAFVKHGYCFQLTLLGGDSCVVRSSGGGGVSGKGLNSFTSQLNLRTFGTHRSR